MCQKKLVREAVDTLLDNGIRGKVPSRYMDDILGSTFLENNRIKRQLLVVVAHSSPQERDRFPTELLRWLFGHTVPTEDQVGEACDGKPSHMVQRLGRIFRILLVITFVYYLGYVHLLPTYLDREEGEARLWLSTGGNSEWRFPWGEPDEIERFLHPNGKRLPVFAVDVKESVLPGADEEADPSRRFPGNREIHKNSYPYLTIYSELSAPPEADHR
ncbi:hypothetical protein Syun_028132 [Stephania yunnanensis]|uniref:Uncharacterized protein n=1 Tax=Stephania yunnanensis TaxID=152371 RepID=A0AAP0EGT0_9MAGN